MSNAKSEKAFIDAKVAKVREVIRNVSTNDIVLALHNFDMDVTRTIQALTENLENALGSWEKNGVSTKKKQQKKKAATAQPASTASVVTEASKTKPTTSNNGVTKSEKIPATPTAKSTQNPEAQKLIASINKLSNNEKLAEIERSIQAFDLKAARIRQIIDTAQAMKSNAIASILAAVHARDRLVGQQLAELRAEAEQLLDKHSKALVQLKSKSSANVGAELARLTHDPKLEEILEGKFSFDDKPVLRAVEKFGAGYLTGKPAGAPVATNGTPNSQVPASVDNWTTVQTNGKTNATPQPPPQEKNKAVQQHNGKGSSPVQKLINDVAKVDINKHSGSQSSLVSSVGEDSGLGQVSPVAQEKSIVQVSDGGIIMQSDGLSSDVLTEIQRRLAENLKAQGIDAAVLSGIAGGNTGSAVSPNTTVVPPRRRPPRKDNAGGAAKKPVVNAKTNGKAVPTR